MTLLTVQQMQERVKRYSYRKGWTIEVREGAFEGAILHIHSIEEDSTKDTEKIELDIYSPIPPQISMESFDLFVQWRLIRIECHESREFLRLKKNGKSVFYPHVRDSDRDLYDLETFKEYRDE